MCHVSDTDSAEARTAVAASNACRTAAIGQTKRVTRSQMRLSFEKGLDDIIE